MADFEDQDFYELLGVTRSASADEIKRAYRREISKYHPDRFANASPPDQEYAQRRSQRLTEAYAVLSDFASRSAYNLGRPAPLGRAPRATAASTPAPQRDHQAELYEQARAHLEAGRTLQAVGVLRQLQQINPFYRDSADLLARTEASLRARQAPSSRSPRRLLLAGGALGGAALILLVAWTFGMRGATPGVTASLPTAPASPAPTEADPLLAAPTAAPAAVAEEPTPLPTLAPTVVPTVAPTEAPTAVPTVAPTEAPTAVPTVAPTLSNAAPTLAPLELQGSPLLEDDFSRGGWASLRGNGWSVGYAEGRYRIAVDAGIGTIWSYRSVTSENVTIASDVQVTSGAGGLVMRFVDEYNYLTFVVDPQQTAYRVEQRRGGVITVLAAGLSQAIGPADAQNRLAARVSGDLLQVAVNGQVLAEVDASGGPVSPRFGLVAISGTSPAEALFDNFQIRAVE
jgi:hypothetical protein